MIFKIKHRSNFPRLATPIVKSISVLLMSVLCLLSSLETSHAETPPAIRKSRVSDFGAEQINFGAQKLLPLSVAEEQDENLKSASVTDSASPLDNLGNQTTSDLSELAASELSPNDDQTTTILNANDIEIATLVKTFSKLTKRNYILDSSVKGKVTIHLPSAVTISEALRIFDTVLNLKGFTTVPVDDNLWKIVKLKDAKQTTIPTITQSPEKPSDAQVTQLLRLKYVQAADMQQLLSPLISPEGSITSFAGTNALIVIDSALNIERLNKLVRELDMPAVDQEITIIPVLHAEAKDLADKVNQILGEKEDGQAGATRIPTTTRAAVAAAARNLRAAAGTSDTSIGSNRTLPLKVIPDERINSLIVVADPELTAKVQALVEQLDSEIDQSSGRFYVYRLKHADADSISEILSSLISGSSSSSTSGGSSGSRGSSINRSKTSAQNASAAATTPSTTGEDIRSRLSRALRQRATDALRTGGAEAGGGGKVSFEGEVAIASDPSTNSLIINASRSDYNKIVEVIQEIDKERPQVLVEATILEVTLTKDQGIGIELQGTAGTNSVGLFAQNNFGGLTNALTNPAALTDLTIAAASAGTVTLPGGLTLPSQAALITAVSRNSNVNVLSAPTIVATDNEEAEIIVGENVPFVTSIGTDTSNINNTFNQIERQDVGITLRITPQISTGDFVNLTIFVEISNVVQGTRNDPNGPTTTIRTTDTAVEVKSGQMVVTGGLISDSVTDATRGIPFLMDIPVLGNLFRRDDTNVRRTNLLIFITPHILKNQFDSRDQTKEANEKLTAEIDTYNIVPNRHEVLKNEKIDNVVEQIQPPDVLPSTITAPQKVSSELGRQATSADIMGDSLLIDTRPKAKSNKEKAARSTSIKSKKDAVISLTASPKLPAATPTKAEVVSTEIAPESTPPIPTEPVAIVPQQRTYIVLRDITGTALPSDSVLRYADSTGTVGYILGGPSDSTGAEFFSIGQRYKYKEGEVLRNFVCLGKYSSLSEVKAIHTELGADSTWNVLSPKDMLSLGKSPWTID